MFPKKYTERQKCFPLCSFGFKNINVYILFHRKESDLINSITNDKGRNETKILKPLT